VLFKQFLQLIRTALYNKLNIADREGQCILRFLMIIGAHGTIVFFTAATLITDVLFKQFLLHTAV